MWLFFREDFRYYHTETQKIGFLTEECAALHVRFQTGKDDHGTVLSAVRILWPNEGTYPHSFSARTRLMKLYAQRWRGPSKFFRTLPLTLRGSDALLNPLAGNVRRWRF